MADIWIFIITIIVIAVSIVLMRIILPPFIKKLKEKGKIGIDVHKPERPEVAEMGGLSILIVACITALIPMIFYDNFFVRVQMVVFIAVIGLVGLIGILDDLYELGAKIKPLLVACASFPLLITNFIWFNQMFNPNPWFPLIGPGFRITILYWLLIPVAITVAANAINMADVLNGSMSGPGIVIFATLLICSLVRPTISVTGAFLSGIMLGCMLVFYKYNRFPAKIFSGDTGTLTIGAALALTGIMGGLEVVTIIVAIPFVINAFQLLASVRGLVEARKIKQRPSIPKPDGTIAANTDVKAPMTLMRIIMAKGPMKEPDISRQFLVLTIFCAGLAIITHILTFYLYLPL
ncbi:MAG: hypothetical protein ACTSQI_09455 [Candidatus Helarchaeota archaeon]